MPAGIVLALCSLLNLRCVSYPPGHARPRRATPRGGILQLIHNTSPAPPCHPAPPRPPSRSRPDPSSPSPAGLARAHGRSDLRSARRACSFFFASRVTNSHHQYTQAFPPRSRRVRGVHGGGTENTVCTHHCVPPPIGPTDRCVWLQIYAVAYFCYTTAKLFGNLRRNLRQFISKVGSFVNSQKCPLRF